MTLKQLEAFYWAATCASFAVAADRLHLSLSSLSKRIAELESALGLDLFDRSGHRAVLTAAGERLLPQARDLLASADRIRASLRAEPELGVRCRFGVGELSALTWLPRLIGRVRGRYPGWRSNPMWMSARCSSARLPKASSISPSWPAPPRTAPSRPRRWGRRISRGWPRRRWPGRPKA